MTMRRFVQLIESAEATDKNLELLSYFKTEDDYTEWWPLFVQWVVYQTEGEGTSIIEEITGEDLSREDFDDEYDAILSLSHQTSCPIFPKI